MCAALSGACAQGQAQSERAGTQASDVAQRKQRVRAAELEAVVADAHAVPAEYGTDALLRLVESGKVTERAWQRELLEDAFRMAGGAQMSVKRRIAPGLIYAYTREDYEARAYQLNLDTMSLRLRAVNAMLKVDKRKARALFEELPRKLPLAPLTCDDALVYAVLDFYDTLTQLATTTFSAEEKARNEDVLFAQAYVDEMDAPEQVLPVALLIEKLGDTPARLAPLVHSYSMALTKIDADDRRFTAAINARIATRLADDCQKQGLAPDELLAALRAYFVAHLRARRCADNEVARYTPSRHMLDHRTLADLNAQLRADESGAQSPVTEDEVKPQQIEGAAKLTPFFSTPTAQTLFRTAQELRFGMADEPQTEEERNDPKRVDKLTAWLNAMSDWRGDGEASEADYFNEKCVLYQLLLEVWPARGPAADALLREYVAFLRQPARQQENRAEWLLHVRRLVESPRYAAGVERARLLTELQSSGEPVLRLYAVLAGVRAQPKETNAP
jgi:hypothetical protein